MTTDLPFPTSLPDFMRMFPDDRACATYLEKCRWPKGFACPKCGVVDEPYRFENRPGVLRCMPPEFKAALQEIEREMRVDGETVKPDGSKY
jgi:hypothetical protein